MPRTLDKGSNTADKAFAESCTRQMSPGIEVFGKQKFTESQSPDTRQRVYRVSNGATRQNKVSDGHPTEKAAATCSWDLPSVHKRYSAKPCEQIKKKKAPTRAPVVAVAVAVAQLGPRAAARQEKADEAGAAYAAQCHCAAEAGISRHRVAPHAPGETGGGRQGRGRVRHAVPLLC